VIVFGDVMMLKSESDEGKEGEAEGEEKESKECFQSFFINSS
jgi:hypothetical protein